MAPCGRSLKLLGPDPLAAAFVPLLLGHNGGDGLEPPRLAELARQALNFIASKPKAEPKVRLRSSSPGDANGAISVLEISNDDMPFLVDLDPWRVAGTRAWRLRSFAPYLQDRPRRRRSPAQDPRAG